MIAQMVNDYADTSSQSSEVPPWASALLVLAVVAVLVLIIASIWTILKAGGQPGWHALVPVLNTYSLANAAGLEGCLIVVLTFVPCVNYITYAYLWWSVGKRFGRSSAFCLGLVLLSPVFVPVLAVSLRREERRTAALPPVGAPGSLPRPQMPAGPGPQQFPAPVALPPAPGAATPGPDALPPLPAPAPLPVPPPAPAAAPPPGPAEAPPAVRLLVDGLEVARLARVGPGTTSEDRQVFAVAGAAPVLEVELADGTRTSFDLSGTATPGATWTLETWVGPAAAAVEAVVTVPGPGGPRRVVLQPILLPGAGVTDADLSGHGLASRGMAVDDGARGTLLVCRCASCGASFALGTEPAAAALYCRTGLHTLAIDSPVARPVHPQVAAELPACAECGGDFSEQHPLRCPSCSMPFVDLARHPEDLSHEHFAPTHQGSSAQQFRLADHGWRAAADGNWYPSTLLG